MDKKYCYTNGTLKNKMGIKDVDILSMEEGLVSFKSLIKNMAKVRKLNPFEPQSYRKIHTFLFGEIYEWAGQYRTIEIGKDSYWFMSPKFFENCEYSIFSKKLDSFENIIEAYNELNIMHPFREGNGRTHRVWLNLALEKIMQKNINFSAISKEDYMEVMIKGHKDHTPMIELFSKHLVDVNDENYKTLFISNAKASYKYEGYNIGDDNFETK